MVVKLVKERYGDSYSCSRISGILHALKFSVQYPTRRLSKTDEQAQEHSRARKLPQLRKKSIRKEPSCAIKMNRAFSNPEPSIGAGHRWSGISGSDPAGS